MLQEIRGIVLQEISVRKPTAELAEIILRAQSQHSDRVVVAKWRGTEGEKPEATATIIPNNSKTPEEIRELSEGITGADVVSVQKILKF